MAYLDDITALGPGHVFTFDGVFTDSVGSLNWTNSGYLTTGVPLCQGASNSCFSDTAGNYDTNASFILGDSLTLPTSPDVDQALSRKALGGWFMATSIQFPPNNIYREGNTGNQYNITMWPGNTVILDIIEGTTIRQVISDRLLQPNRPYHIFTRFEGTGFGNKIELYLDGVKQLLSIPDTGIAGFATLGARTPAVTGYSVTSEVGNSRIDLNATANGHYNYWATFSDAAAQNLTETQIRVELFEKGALPGVTITSGTQAAMQTQLDALANTVMPDEPLNIRVEPVTGDGDLTLVANNITHNPLASINVQYTGTGTLTYVRDNGSDASIFSTPNGGTITPVTPAVLTAAPLKPNSEVRYYLSGTETELAGVENSGTSFSASLQAASVDVVIVSIQYVNIKIDGIDMTGGDVNLPISQQFDRNYENP